MRSKKERSARAARGVKGVVRCFVERAELQRLLCNMAAVELAHAMVRAALRAG